MGDVVGICYVEVPCIPVIMGIDVRFKIHDYVDDALAAIAYRLVSPCYLTVMH